MSVLVLLHGKQCWLIETVLPFRQKAGWTFLFLFIMNSLPTKQLNTHVAIWPFHLHAWEKGILETGVKMPTLCAAAAAVVSEKLSPPSRLVA